MVWFTRLLLLFVLALTLGPPPARAQANRACQILTAAEARAVMGVAMEPSEQDDSTCQYLQAGFADRAPNNRTIRLAIYTHPKPNPNAITNQLDNFKRYYSPPPTSIMNVGDVGDAAIWAWRGDVGGELFAYSGGTLEVQVWIRGLPQQQAYAAARSLAASALGSAARTGFAYAGAPQPPAAAPPPGAPAARPEPRVSSGQQYAQARFITTSEFFRSLKEVDLDALQQVGVLSRLLPETRITSILTGALARYGIHRHDGAPVKLQVIVSDDNDTITEGSDKTYIHGLQVEIRFLVAAVALRNGRFVGVRAAPAEELDVMSIEEDNAARKLFFGDRTAARFEQAFGQVVREAFDSFAKRQDKPTAWTVSGWTASEQAAAQAKFEQALASVRATEVTRTSAQFANLDIKPYVLVEPQMSGGRCRVDSTAWKHALDAALTQRGLVRQVDPPLLTLHHIFGCEYLRGNTEWYRVTDILIMNESNLVFPLNGQTVRAWGTIEGSVHTKAALEDTIDDLMRDYLPARVKAFAAVK